MKRQMFILFIFTISLGSFSFLNAEIGGGFRGGSLFSSSVGSHTLSLNGANFWTSKRSGFSLLLPLSFHLNNNLVSTDWLNTYLLSGQHLDDQTVDTMLDEIPDSGLLLNGNGNFMLFGLSYKWLAMYVGGSVDIYGAMPKSIFQTVFHGIEFERNIDLTDTQFGFLSYLPISIVLSTKIGNNLYAGVGLKELMGLGYFSMNSSGSVKSQADRLSGNGTVDIHYNLGEISIVRDSLLAYSTEGKFTPEINGRGYAIDIGITKRFSDSWTMGFSAQNIIGTIDWNKESSHKHVLEFNVELTSDEFEEIINYSGSQQDSLLETIINKDDVYSIDTLKTTVPLKIELTNEIVFGTRFLLFKSASYEFGSEIISEPQVEFSGGFRWLLHRRFPVTLGITHNSLWGLKWGGGLGFHLKNYHLDVLCSQNGGFINKGKGFSLNIINYFYF